MTPNSKHLTQNLKNTEGGVFMTNYAFQGVDEMLSTASALAIHLFKCAAKALKKHIGVTSTLKGGVSHGGNRA